MDAATTRWFQRRKESYAATVELGLMDAGHIVRELAHRDSLREAFLPGAIVSTIDLVKILTKTGELSDDDLGVITDEKVHQYISRLKERDARFNYEVVFTRDQPPIRPSTPPRNLLASVARGNTVINIYPRDFEALRANPPGGTLRVRGSGADKLLDFVRTGRPQTLRPEEIIDLKTTFDYALPADQDHRQIQLDLAQNFTGAETIPMRVTCGEGPEAIEYSYAEFRLVRQGKEEFEIATLPGAPIEISIVSRRNGSGVSVSFAKTFEGSSPLEMQKFLRAAKAISISKTVSLFDLRREVPMQFRNAEFELLDYLDQLGKFIDDAVVVSSHYNVPLTFPEAFSEDDLATVAFLKELIRGTELPVGKVSATLDKTADASPESIQSFSAEGRFFMYRPQCPIPVNLFGKTFVTGPVEIDIEKARVVNADEYREFLQEAPLGTSFEIKVEAVSKMRLRSLLENTN